MTSPAAVQLHRAGGPTTSGGQSTEEMTATEEERLKHTAAAPAQATAAHSFGSSGETCTVGAPHKGIHWLQEFCSCLPILESSSSASSVAM